MAEILTDSVLILGAVLAAVGAWRLWGAAGLIVAGAILVSGSLLYARSSR